MTPHRTQYLIPALAAIAAAALLAAGCSSTSSPGTSAASTATITASASASPAGTAGGDSARETAEQRLESIGTQLGTAQSDYAGGKKQQAYTLAKSASSSLYEGTTEGFCARLDLAGDRQLDSLLAATLPAAIQNGESPSAVAALIHAAQQLAQGCLNAIHKSE